jgi:hypothetical protein
MGFVNITIVDPNPDGTPIYDVSNGTGSKQLLGMSTDWSTRMRSSVSKGGCPSWIDQIVVAPDLKTCQATPIHTRPIPGIASSSFSSRDVLAIFVDKKGEEDHRAVYPYVYVAKSHSSIRIDPITGKPVPVADEMWFSSKPVNDTVVIAIEGMCNHALE